MPTASIEQMLQLCRTVIAPLVRADGGELYVVAVDPEQISLHLGGTCSGCPGASITTRRVIEPALHAVSPALRVHVTTGVVVPSGAWRVEPEERGG